LRDAAASGRHAAAVAAGHTALTARLSARVLSSSGFGLAPRRSSSSGSSSGGLSGGGSGLAAAYARRYLMRHAVASGEGTAVDAVRRAGRQ
jgi:hypothetical protein